MNVKFRMPKVRGNAKVRSTAKELLLTTIATTISIVLTFGTAAYLENKQQRADGRQTAMLVVHDIELSAKRIETYTKLEEEHYKLTQYVLEHMSNIGAIHNDTLNTVLHYIMRTMGSDFKFDDSTEKLFFSSQDVWKNINNATYIDVVQRFFYERRATYEYMNTSEVFRKPVVEEEVWQNKYFKSNGNYDFPAFISDHLTRPDVQMYLTNNYSRIRRLNTYLEQYQAKAKRCKFMMEISDEELSDFIARRMNSGLPPTDKQLEGVWRTDDGGENAQDFEFRKDHTFTLTTTARYPHILYMGKVNVVITNTGTWQMEGDSIILLFRPEIDYSIDRSNITVLPDKEKEVEQQLAELNNMYEDYQKNCSQLPEVRKSGTLFIDRSGNRLELLDTEQDSYEYLSRVEQ